MVAAEGSLIAFGIVIACYFNIGMYYANGPVVWRTPIAAQLIFIIAQVALVMVLPESPRWLSKRESRILNPFRKIMPTNFKYRLLTLLDRWAPS